MTVILQGWAETLRALFVVAVSVGTIVFFCSRIAKTEIKMALKSSSPSRQSATAGEPEVRVVGENDKPSLPAADIPKIA